MSEDRDEALMRSLFAEGAAPLGDEDFVGGVMTRVSKDAAEAQTRVAWMVWIGVALAAFLGAMNFTAIIAEVSRAFASVNWTLPAMGGSATVLLLAAAAAGGAYLFAERN